MRKHLGLAVLAGGMLLSWTVWAQDQPEPGRGQPPGKPDALQGIEISHKQLELQAQMDEVTFQQKMREMQLEKQRLELDKERAALQSAPGQPAQPGMRPAMGPQPVPGLQPPRGPIGGPACPMARHHARGFAFFMGLCFIVHILLAIWVYQDIRKRNTGSDLWIAITLLSGFFGAALYALVRIGDKPAA